MEICPYEFINIRMMIPTQLHITCYGVIKIIREYLFFLFERNELQDDVIADQILFDIFYRSKFKHGEKSLADPQRWMLNHCW
jgi:hypothetical protein